MRPSSVVVAGSYPEDHLDTPSGGGIADSAGGGVPHPPISFFFSWYAAAAAAATAAASARSPMPTPLSGATSAAPPLAEVTVSLKYLGLLWLLLSVVACSWPVGLGQTLVAQGQAEEGTTAAADPPLSGETLEEAFSVVEEGEEDAPLASVIAGFPPAAALTSGDDVGVGSSSPPADVNVTPPCSSSTLGVIFPTTAAVAGVIGVPNAAVVVAVARSLFCGTCLGEAPARVPAAVAAAAAAVVTAVTAGSLSRPAKPLAMLPV